MPYAWAKFGIACAGLLIVASIIAAEPIKATPETVRVSDECASYDFSIASSKRNGRIFLQRWYPRPQP